MRERQPSPAPFIVVGLDDTASARRALEWAAGQARLTGAVLRAVHVLDWDIGVAAFGSPSRLDDCFLHEHEVAPAYRRGIRRDFEDIHPLPSWDLQFAQGDVGPILVKAARRAAMLVIGCRPWRGFDSDVASPVAHYCLSHLQCPVVAIPAAGADASSMADAAAP